MRCLDKNKTEFFYALYEGRVPVVDEDGNLTGEHETKHGNPISCSANISAAKGETQTRQFGESESYDKVVVMGMGAPPIDEYTLLWIDTIPQLNEDGTLMLNADETVITSHDYIVKKVARSLNCVSFAVSKVNVRE